jgi:hypothetical protein
MKNKIRTLFENIKSKYKYSKVEMIMDIFRYDIWRFLKNIWSFRKELWNHAWWDYHFTLQILYRSIHIMEKGMHKGLEVRESREKKIQKMQRLLYLLDNKIKDNYTELAEKELGIKMVVHPWEFTKLDRVDSDGEPLYEILDKDTPEEKEINRKIFDRAREIEEKHWNEIWEILKGQDHNQMLDIIQEKSLNQNKEEKDWNDWFDGSGLRGWWD